VLRGDHVFKKIVVGVAVVAISLGIAMPAAAASKGTDGLATTMSPGILCIWLGWC